MYHLDRHVNKMALESLQLLCSAIWVCGEEAPYKLTHKNHPCAIWARESRQNWRWLKKLAICLCEEYTFRYKKIHAVEKIVKDLKVPKALPKKPFSPPPQAMPDCYKVIPKEGQDGIEASIQAYRNYYILGKAHLHLFKKRHAWKDREVPEFILSLFPEYENYNGEK